MLGFFGFWLPRWFVLSSLPSWSNGSAFLLVNLCNVQGCLLCCRRGDDLILSCLILSDSFDTSELSAHFSMLGSLGCSDLNMLKLMKVRGIVLSQEGSPRLHMVA